MDDESESYEPSSEHQLLRSFSRRTYRPIAEQPGFEIDETTGQIYGNGFRIYPTATKKVKFGPYQKYFPYKNVVYTTFHGPIPEGKSVYHINGNDSDFSPSNLALRASDYRTFRGRPLLTAGSQNMHKNKCHARFIPRR